MSVGGARVGSKDYGLELVLCYSLVCLFCPGIAFGWRISGVRLSRSGNTVRWDWFSMLSTAAFN